MAKQPVILIAGPTASGKSGLAMTFAKQTPSVIINADSMQVYKDLTILTACPSTQDKTIVPHKLYEIFDHETICSAGLWVSLALKEIQEAHNSGLQPIVVGGTGLYFKSLQEGISPIPASDTNLAKSMQDRPIEELYAELIKVDPLWAKEISPQDLQRTIRGLCVYKQTGMPISQWHRDHPPQAPNLDFKSYAILPDRPILKAQADQRFDQMMEAGALKEVEQFKKDNLYDSRHPLSRALGLRPLLGHLEGNFSLQEAINLGKIETHQYIKRQFTWFTHQFRADMVLKSSQDAFFA